ncbi:peptidase M48 [Spirochaetia bacterium]|nr:peptidase M48 [Spirochaetia bacterium]
MLKNKWLTLTKKSNTSRWLVLLVLALCLAACQKNPLTGKRTMAFVSNDGLFAESFLAYTEFLDESEVITETEDARIVEQVGDNLRKAAEQWLLHEGNGDYLSNYQWEYHLVANDEPNAWCMPGGKIVVYTGILPAAQNADALAAVLGHEIAHALLNHGQQRTSAAILQTLGAIGVAVATAGEDSDVQDTAAVLYDIGSEYLGRLPFSRANESEADEIGLILMTIAGYDPHEAVNFWQRMDILASGGQFEFFSTHPANDTRIENIQNYIDTAQSVASLVTGVPL